MLRGDIYLVDFDPAPGSEADKRRPAVIVSNDAVNRTVTRLGRGTVTVIPLTSNVSRIHPFQVALPSSDSGLLRDSKAQAEQIRTVSISRVGGRVGVVPGPLMDAIDDAVRLHLAL